MEKKKRFRPSVTEYKALQQEVALWRERCQRLSGDVESQVDGTSVLVGDCDAWREKYHVMMARCSALEKSNKLMEDELSRVKEQRDQLASTCAAREMDIRNLRSRGFFRRVFNR